MLKSNYQGGLGDQNEFSGTTFVATVVRGDMLWCANIGDSRLIVGVNEGGAVVAKDVSEDHKPDAPAEKVAGATSPGTAGFLFFCFVFHAPGLGPVAAPVPSGNQPPLSLPLDHPPFRWCRLATA